MAIFSPPLPSAIYIAPPCQVTVLLLKVELIMVILFPAVMYTVPSAIYIAPPELPGLFLANVDLTIVTLFE